MASFPRLTNSLNRTNVAEIIRNERDDFSRSIRNMTSPLSLGEGIAYFSEMMRGIGYIKIHHPVMFVSKNATSSIPTTIEDYWRIVSAVDNLFSGERPQTKYKPVIDCISHWRLARVLLEAAVEQQSPELLGDAPDAVSNIALFKTLLLFSIFSPLPEERMNHAQAMALFIVIYLDQEARLLKESFVFSFGSPQLFTSPVGQALVQYAEKAEQDLSSVLSALKNQIHGWMPVTPVTRQALQGTMVLFDRTAHGQAVEARFPSVFGVATPFLDEGAPEQDPVFVQPDPA